MLELIYTSTKLIDNSYLVARWSSFFSDPSKLAYINDLDAMVLVMNRHIFKIFRDGTNCYLGYVANSDWDVQFVGVDRGRIAWRKYVAPSYLFYLSDEISFLPHEMEPIFPSFSISYTAGEYPIYLDLNKSLVITSNYNKITCYDANTSLALWSFTFEVKYAGSVSPVVNFVDIDHIMITGGSTGSYSKSFGALVNINTGAVISVVEFPYTDIQYANLQVYDYNHGIFITIGLDRIVRVYANDYYPYSFGPIIPEHYGLFSYVGQDIKVQLTSIGGFSCPDRLVTWYLPTGLGSLEKAVSVTDANGYAWNYYYGPLVAGGLETITVGWG